MCLLSSFVPCYEMRNVLLHAAKGTNLCSHINITNRMCMCIKNSVTDNVDKQ